MSGILVGIVSIIGGYQYIYRNYNQENKKPMQQEEYQISDLSLDLSDEKANIQQDITDLQQNLSKEVGTQDSEKILPSTKLVYQYYYALDQKVMEEESDPPYYLLDMTREQLQEKLSDWELQLFSDKKVVLRKVLQEKSPHHYYLVGVYDGCIAVFYDINGEWVLREITATPISVLPHEEQKKLEQGIPVYGEEELIRILEDYTS